jgi:hypothetical protein
MGLDFTSVQLATDNSLEIQFSRRGQPVPVITLSWTNPFIEKEALSWQY